MNLLTCILVAIPVGIVFTMLWIFNDYRSYKNRNRLVILFFLLFPAALSAQCVDAGCQISFRWLENQKEKLEYAKDGITYKFIPDESQWEIIICNNTSEDVGINWKSAQLIVNGRAATTGFPHSAETANLPAIVKSRTEISRNIGIAGDDAKKATPRIYNKKDIRKGKNSSFTIILPLSIGNRPQFFTTFDFIIKKAN